MGVYYGEGYATRAYALAEVPATDFSPGKMINTGRELDISVDGEGFIAVQAPDGQEAYTRAGSFYVDSVGMLRTGNGLPVMGNGGPVAIPESDKIDIAIDGTISIIPLGQAKDGIVQIDRIKLVNPPVESLVKSEDGLIRQRVGPPPPSFSAASVMFCWLGRTRRSSRSRTSVFSGMKVSTGCAWWVRRSRTCVQET